MSQEIHGFRGRITASRFSKIGSRIKHYAMVCDLNVTKFYEDKGFLLTTVVFEVTSTNEDDVKVFVRWFNAIDN